MKDSKYYLLLIFSICIFIYVYAFMPSVPLLSDYSDDVWVSNPEDVFTDFYNNGVQDTNAIKDAYIGNVSVSSLLTSINIGISSMQTIYKDYTNTTESYNVNASKLFEIYGIENYTEFVNIYNSVKNIYAKNPNDIVNIAIINKSTIINRDKILNVEMIVDYKSGTRNIYDITIYNDENIKVFNGAEFTSNIKFEYKGE
ncbi:MAG: hypothetical protein PHH22_02490 [Clostridia bacterium]|nr:hypothetical protein [Clostridia bacterium]